jgi:hypothetical protein
VFDAIVEAAAAESPLWGEAALPEDERLWVPVFSQLAAESHALGLETIYEGYLVHYGRSRLFEPADGETALLLGDYLYAHGLVRIAATGELDAVVVLAELISTCAHLRAEQAAGDGEAWIDAVRSLGGDPGPGAVEQALAAHAGRLVSSRP